MWLLCNYPWNVNLIGFIWFIFWRLRKYVGISASGVSFRAMWPSGYTPFAADKKNLEEDNYTNRQFYGPLLPSGYVQHPPYWNPSIWRWFQLPCVYRDLKSYLLLSAMFCVKYSLKFSAVTLWYFCKGKIIVLCPDCFGCQISWCLVFLYIFAVLLLLNLKSLLW